MYAYNSFSAFQTIKNVASVLVTVSVRCTVDLKRENRLQIHIEKKKPKSDCILKLNSLAKETATIPSQMVSYVSFIDCQEKDLLISIKKTIGKTAGLYFLNRCQSRPFSGNAFYTRY